MTDQDNTRRALLQSALDRSGLTASALARKAGLPTANAIYNFMAGRAGSLSARTYAAIAPALSVSVDEIMGVATHLPQRAGRHNPGVAENQAGFGGDALAGLQAENRRLRGLLEQSWRQENRAAVCSSNDFVDRHGIPLLRHRRF